MVFRGREDHCAITITDNGIGLPQDRNRLFEPYVTTRAEGTGLGLSIVRKIIEEHGGTLRLTDATAPDGAPQRGAMADIRLPRLAAARNFRRPTGNRLTLMGDILIVDDERDIRELISEILQDEGFTTRLAPDSDQAMAEVNADPPALMILDIWLKDSKMDGIDILMSVKRSNPDIPIVIISGHGNVEIAVAAIKQGAYDFIEKPFNIDKLMVVIGRAMEASRLRRENQDLRRREVGSAQLLGDSAAYRALCSQLEKVTGSNARLMFTGPSGCGKEAAARFVHENSDRASAPFVTVTSAAVEPDRMEEVLFGRESADRGVEQGLLEQAHGGVVFLDEVADMPLGTQSKLLRVLVEQQFIRTGGTDKVRVDLRVMSATTQDLGARVREGLFRQELFDRLNVVPIRVPGLEERREDIPLLADHFIDMLHSTQGCRAARWTTPPRRICKPCHGPEISGSCAT